MWTNERKMNSTIASNIIGGLSFNQQVASGSCSSVLSSHIEFAVTDNKESYSVSNNQEKYLWKLAGEGAADTVINGLNKVKSNFHQNKNSIVNPYVLLNGNKGKMIEDGIQVPKVQLFTGKICMEWKQVYRIGAGLNNLGNTCFMNTVVQCLTYCPPLANYLLHDSDHLSKCSVTGFCMMCVMQRHMKRTIGKAGQVIKPLDVYQKLRSIAKHFQFGRQEDAHEFLRYVIDNLWKSCLANINGAAKLDAASKETTVINHIFGGYHRSQVTCLRCKGKSNTYDHFMDFILDIKQNVLTLEKALEKFTHPELLQLENAYRCPKCKMKVNAQKRFTVYRAPNVATFQLKRFDYHRAFGGKITKQITYPEKLNLRPYMSDTKGYPVWYHLNAVLIHSGPSCNSGHYYCYVKNSNGFWYLMDDQRVHQVSINQVLNETAYVLFYIRMMSSEGISAKKCIENKSHLVKSGISASNTKRDISILKPFPLSENMQAGTPNSTKLQNSGFNILNKKSTLPLTQNRERVSFDIRPKQVSLKQSVESRNSPLKFSTKPSQSTASVASNNKSLVSISSPTKSYVSIVSRNKNHVPLVSPAKSHLPLVSLNKNHVAGLVPYVNGSSESSDDEPSSVFSAKVFSVPHKEPITDKSISLNSSKKHPVTQCHKNEKDNANVHLSLRNFIHENKAKVSQSVFPANRPLHCNVSTSANSASHKVRATAVWSVTDINLHSPSVGSGSSSTSVNSTTDWNVVTTEPETKKNNGASEQGAEVKISEKRDDSEANLQTNIIHKIHFSNDSSYYQKCKKKLSLLKEDNQEDRVNANDSSSNNNDRAKDKFLTIPTTGKCLENGVPNSVFRKYKERREHSFLANGASPKQQKKKTFLKRSFGDANQISKSPSQLDGISEDRHSPVPKKAKTAIERDERKDNGNHSFDKRLSELDDSSETDHSKNTSKSCDSKRVQDVAQQNDSVGVVSNRRTKVTNGELVKQAKCDSNDSEESSSCSSNSSLEYEWVEKTKDTIKKDSQTCLKKHNVGKPKDVQKNRTISPIQSIKDVTKQNIAVELNKCSKFFYGAQVPSWTGENNICKPSSFESRRHYFDDYDDDLDKGKVRKFKTHYRYQDSYRDKDNPFQRYQNKKTFKHSIFYDKTYYSDYGYKNFNSQYNWKQHRNDYYNSNRRHYKSYSAR